MSGFIVIDRDIWKHPAFKAGPMTEREAFMWMVAKAAWADTKHRVGSELFDVPRGGFMTTLRELQRVFMWGSDKRVRSFLNLLEKQEIIGRKVCRSMDARKTHVTICNYEEYQSPGRKKDAGGTQAGRKVDAIKEPDNHKPVKRDTNVSPKKRGSRLPEDWVLSAPDGKWAVEQGWSESTVREEADRFFDYWTSLPGAKACKLDWSKTWKNWMRNKPKEIARGDVDAFTGIPMEVVR